MIEIFVPALLIAYLEAFSVAFNKPGYTYFIGFIWACRSGRITAAIRTVVAIYSGITGKFSDCSHHSAAGGFVFPYWQG